MYKFEHLEVWQEGLRYLDLVYEISDHLPSSEDQNLRPQLVRSATSMLLNIAEGSTGQSNAEQVRFLGYALRSLYETVACLRIVERRGYVTDKELLERLEENGHVLARKLHAMRNAIAPNKPWLKESEESYVVDTIREDS